MINVRDGHTPVDCRFLDMDRKEFVANYDDWIERFQDGGLLRTAISVQHGQVLYAGGRGHFDEFEAVRLCQKLSGVITGAPP